MAEKIYYLLLNGKYLSIGGNLLRMAINKSYDVKFTGYILSDQGSLITERGFIYGNSPDELNNTIISSDTSIVFTSDVALTSGTYYYKSYAINSMGTSYGELKSITIS
jgi:hypothetical protein